MGTLYLWYKLSSIGAPETPRVQGVLARIIVGRFSLKFVVDFKSTFSPVLTKGPSATSMDVNHRLLDGNREPFHDIEFCWETIGIFRWVWNHTYPGIATATNYLSRFVSCPTTTSSIFSTS
ncbi:unnamed protein product [Phytophthora fragariaefolia]|uniref:Unnamed protein product n=1 Tax=Phytophthora fragariaefolia TaxID=1490495 RepID=A0A9W7D421_9STRA|nr:unnamed protein product [Phytophthora fragariaefolia]